MIKIMKYGQVPNCEIFARVTPAVNVEQIVAEIIADVRANGDRAVLDYNLRFDKAQLDTLAVSQEEIEEAFSLWSRSFCPFCSRLRKTSGPSTASRCATASSLQTSPVSFWVRR